MVNIIRRVSCILLALCLASSLMADSYPNITKSEVVSLDVKTIEVNANRGTPFELVLGGTQVTVVLWPAPVWPDEGLRVVEIGRDGAETESLIQGNITYAGDVVGEDPAESEVRLTIADGTLEGYVLASTGWWFIEPLSRFDPKGSPGQYLVYAAHHTVPSAEFPDDNAKTDVVYDYPFVKDGVIAVVMVSDKNYIDQSGSLSAAIVRQSALLNELSGIYRDQFGRWFKFPTAVADLRGEVLTSTSPGTLLTQFVNYLTLQKLVSYRGHIAHLTTGKDLNGNTFGKAERPGYRSLSQQTLGDDFQNEIVAAHEIGHNFDAVHEQADHWCELIIQNLCIIPKQTLDAEVFQNYSTRRFSDGTRDPGHNNAAKICANLAGRGFPCRQP